MMYIKKSYVVGALVVFIVMPDTRILSHESDHYERGNKGVSLSQAYNRLECPNHRNPESICLIEKRAEDAICLVEKGAEYEDVEDGITARAKEHIQLVGEGILEKAHTVKERLGEAAQYVEHSVKQGAQQTAMLAQKVGCAAQQGAKDAVQKAKHLMYYVKDSVQHAYGRAREEEDYGKHCIIEYARHSKATAKETAHRAREEDKAEDARL